MIKIGAGNLNEVFEELEREKGISKDVVISSLCDAMVAAYKKHLRIKEIENVEAFLDEQSGEIGIFKGKTVVDKVEDPDNEISLAEAKEIERQNSTPVLLKEIRDLLKSASNEQKSKKTKEKIK